MKRKFAITALLLAILFFAVFYYYPVKAFQGTDKISRAADTGIPASNDTSHSAQPKIQVVFALDATGSMSGLIDAAKEKIWSIAGSLAQADPSPVVEMGLLFYRDRGDVFITKEVPLSKNLDDVYEKLIQINADGGGDQPESVNQALYESITRFDWDSSDKTYKTVFLVGDCPPHMDYRDDIKYTVSCVKAKQKDIVLNAILMGNNSEAKTIWKAIANCNQGSFTEVNMRANDIEVNTPYDSVISVLSDQLDDTRIYYGDEKQKGAAADKVEKTKFITRSAKANVKAQRAEYNFTTTGKDSYYGDKELLEEYRDKKVVVEDIKKEELPEEMKNMSTAEKTKYVEQKLAKRDSLNKELIKYSKLRQEYIQKDLSSRDTTVVENSFSNQIYKSIQKQTEKKNIRLKEKAKY